MAYALVPRAPMMPMRGVACRRGAGFRGDVATGEVGASPPAWPRSLSRPDCGAPMGRFPSAWPPCLRYGVDERSGFSRQEMEGGQSRDRAKGRRERGRNAPPSGTHGTVAPSEGRGFPFAGEGWPYPWLLPGRSRVRSFLPSFLRPPCILRRGLSRLILLLLLLLLLPFFLCLQPFAGRAGAC